MTRTADLRVSSSLIGEFPRCISPVWQLTDTAVMNKAVAPGEFAGKLWESAHLDEFCGNLCGKETYRLGSVDSLPDLLAELPSTTGAPIGRCSGEKSQGIRWRSGPNETSAHDAYHGKRAFVPVRYH